MTTKGALAAPGAGASTRAQRRLAVQLSVFTISVVTFTAAWLGIVHATDRSAATASGATVELSAGGNAATSLVPAPQAGAPSRTLRSSRAS
jgi:hypothetical protein